MSTKEQCDALTKELQSMVKKRNASLEGNKLQDDAGGGWAMQENPPRRTLAGHFGKVYALHWAGKSASSRLVSASQDGKLIVWDALTTNKEYAIPLRSSWVMTCAFEQNGNEMVAAGGLDNICSIYKVSDQGENTRAQHELEGHDGYLSCCRFRGKEEIITSSGDSTCILWDVETHKTKQTFDQHQSDVMGISISPTDNHLFASGSCDTTLKVWDDRTGQAEFTFGNTTCGDDEVHDSDINSVDFMANGQTIASGSDDSTCKIWDMRSYSILATFADEKAIVGITSVAFSSKGRLLFQGLESHNVNVWNVLDGSMKGRCCQHQNRVSCLGVQNDGNALATGSWDMSLMIWA